MGVSPQNAYCPFASEKRWARRGGAAVVVLDVVEAVFVCLPHLNPGAGKGVPLGVGHRPFHPARLAGSAAGNVAADPDLRRVGDEKRPEDRGFGCRTVGLVVHRDGLHRDAQDIREQHELLPGLVW